MVVFLCLLEIGAQTVMAQTTLADFFPNLGKYQDTQADVSQSFDRHGQFISNVSTQTPDPYQPVTITIQAPNFDANRLMFVWLVNGQEKASGLGRNSFTFNNGGVGEYTTVSLSVYSAGSDTQWAGSWSFGAGEVSLVAESLGYVPPFYKGKNLYAYQGTALVRAIPNLVSPRTGKKYPNSQLIFAWGNDMGSFASESGIGRDTFTFGHQAFASMFEDQSYVTVRVESLDGLAAAGQTIVLEPSEVEALIYEEDVTLGLMFNRAVNREYNLKDGQTVASFRLMPFYFSFPNSSSVRYTWYQNYQPVDNNNSRSLRLILAEEGGQVQRGSAFIDADVINNNLFMQNVQNRRPGFTINF